MPSRGFAINNFLGYVVQNELCKQITNTNRSEVWHETPACIRDLILCEGSAVLI
jgi:hypothetical protein